MKIIRIILLFILLSSFVLAETPEYPQNYSLDLKFNFTNFMENQKGEISAAKVLGGLVLAFLLISEVYFIRKKRN